mgnify:CR=1 FL=1
MFYILNSKWLTFWTFEYTVYWLIAYKLKINFVTKYMNPIYLLLLIAYGYLYIVFYQLIINKTYYEPLFLALHILLHFIPVFLVQYFQLKNYPESFFFTIIVIILYLLYLQKKNFSFRSVYLKPRHIQNFKDLTRHMKQHSGIWYKIANLMN